MDFQTLVLARMREYFGVHARWQRRLWGVGLVLSLRELLEASEGVRDGALGAESFKWFAESVRQQLGQDPGVGDDEQRRALDGFLRQDIAVGGVAHNAVSRIVEDIDEHYLSRWSRALRDPAQCPRAERTSRALAAYLLDRGYSYNLLHGWLVEVSGSEGFEIADLPDAAAAFLQRPPRTFDAVVVFQTQPHVNHDRNPLPPGWMTPAEISTWLEEHGLKRIRTRGGVRLSIDALDPEGAAAEAAAIADRLSARVAVGTRSELRLPERIFVTAADGHGAVTSLPYRRNRKVEVPSIERQGKVFDLDTSGPVDAALELLAHLDAGPPPVAVAAGWSAIEALLTGPGDKNKVPAADRLASLVACAWPRAELLTLAWARQQQPAEEDDRVAGELAALQSSQDRVDYVLETIERGDALGLTDPAERAAHARMAELARDPRKTLTTVRTYAQHATRRLYRQRNLVLHGGRTWGIALEASLRTAAPLVGAGLDRIAYSHLSHGRQPLETAAQAEVEIQRAGTETAPRLTALLD